MWDDEASVVWFAKNYNREGKIVAYDRQNIFSYRNGQLIDNQLGYNNPPVDIYYAAAVIRKFGDSDRVLRIAFTLPGILALLMYLGCLRKLTDEDNTWFAYTATLLTLSVNYLLIEQNVRYYSLNFLFAALSLLATLNVIGNTTKRSRIFWLLLQVAALYLLFLSHSLAAVCWWAMCLWLMYRGKVLRFSFRHRLSVTIAAANALLFVADAYFFISQNSLNRPDLNNRDNWIVKYRKLAEWLFVDLNALNVLPLIAALILLLIFLFRRKTLSPAMKTLLEAETIFLLLILILNPQPTSASAHFDVRYLYIILPLLYAWTAYLLTVLHRINAWGKVAAITATGIFVCSTLFSCIPSPDGPRLLLPSYIEERSKPFPTAYSALIQYIHQHFDGRKKILTLPGYHNTVLLRYVPELIELTNTLDSATTPLSHRTVDSLNMHCLYIGACKPDYVFQFGSTETLADYPFKVTDFRFSDTLWIYAAEVDITRPELFWHSFGPRALSDSSRQALYIFHD
ncbi:hypothetical protein GCM10023092_10960 [Rurimicrobium arvi]|uniref:Glycosyltransferase RgtA/B/C/D-like domain-containing protein n=2 Tax=Rurimicrobium arvi TaxID=2049916 RepID=A0ABP8MKN4_9BACT